MNFERMRSACIPFLMAVSARIVAGAVVVPLVLLACSDLKEGDVDANPTDPMGNAFTQDEEKATLIESWIERMDPFVTQSADGTYFLDWDGFLNSIRNTHPAVVRHFLTGGDIPDDARAVLELKESMAAGNAILETQGGLATLGWGCWTYWWGRRCCYWGDTGWQIVALMTGGSFINPWGRALTPLSAWAGYLMQVHGGFCANGSWAGAIWLTAP